MQRTTTDARALPSSRAALARIGMLVGVLAAASLIGYKLGWFDYQHTLEHVKRLRQGHNFLIFSIGFVAVYGIGTAVGIPGLPFTVAAGALFGTLLGSALAWVGAMVGATTGYWIARTVGHDVVSRWVKRFKRVDTALGQACDFAGIMRLRLIPVFPLGTVNFVGGLARSPFGVYLLATAIGIIPSTIIYTYFADSLLEGVGNGRADAMRSLIIASVLLILLSLTPKFFNRGKSDKDTSSSAAGGAEFASGGESGEHTSVPNSHA
jgi:uncharacterized membrane protein YdjX (TVP38/TMEM64 family)